MTSHSCRPVDFIHFLIIHYVNVVKITEPFCRWHKDLCFHSPAHLPQASAPIILPRPMLPAQRPLVPEVRTTGIILLFCLFTTSIVYFVNYDPIGIKFHNWPSCTAVKHRGQLWASVRIWKVFFGGNGQKSEEVRRQLQGHVVDWDWKQVRGKKNRGQAWIES